MAKEIIYENYKELKRAGIIKGATIHINYKSFGFKAVANLLITVDPSQADRLIEYGYKIPDIYSVHSIGPAGNIRLVAAIKTFHQLDEIKDSIKQKFSITEIKTLIWTDVKEMHENLTISNPDPTKTVTENTINQDRYLKSPVAHGKNEKLDKIDFQIAEKLSINGREPLSKMAQQIGISTNSIIKRYQKLKKNGVIKATIQIDPTKLGYHAIAVFFTAFTTHADPTDIIKRISQIPDIISIMKTSGDYDLQIFAMIKNIDQLLDIREELTEIPGFAKMDIDITRILNKWPTPRQYISTF